MAMSQSCVKRIFMAHSRMVDRTPQDQDKYIVRFPGGMRDRLKADAEKNKRSLNAEIIARLEFTLGMDDLDNRTKGSPTPPSPSDYSGLDPTNPTSVLQDIREELAALRAELIETRRMPDGRDEYTIRRKNTPSTE